MPRGHCHKNRAPGKLGRNPHYVKDWLENVGKHLRLYREEIIQETTPMEETQTKGLEVDMEQLAKEGKKVVELEEGLKGIAS